MVLKIKQFFKKLNKIMAIYGAAAAWVIAH